MDVIRHHPPPAPILPPTPAQSRKTNASPSRHVQKVESRQKYCKNRCEMRHTHTHTHRGKHRTKTMRNAEVNTFLHSARRLGHFFAIKHRKNRCESRSKIQFWVRKVPKLEFQHMPSKESHHPAWRQTQRLPTTTTTKPVTQQQQQQQQQQRRQRR